MEFDNYPFIVDFPFKNCDLSIFHVTAYQMVLMKLLSQVRWFVTGGVVQLELKELEEASSVRFSHYEKFDAGGCVAQRSSPYVAVYDLFKYADTKGYLTEKLREAIWGMTLDLIHSQEKVQH